MRVDDPIDRLRHVLRKTLRDLSMKLVLGASFNHTIWFPWTQRTRIDRAWFLNPTRVQGRPTLSMNPFTHLRPRLVPGVRLHSPLPPPSPTLTTSPYQHRLASLPRHFWQSCPATSFILSGAFLTQFLSVDYPGFSWSKRIRTFVRHSLLPIGISCATSFSYIL